MVISIFHTHECHFLFYFSALRVRSFELFKTNIRARVSHCRLTPKRRFFEIPVQRDSSGGRPKRVRFAVFKRLNCHLDNNRFRLSAGFFAREHRHYERSRGRSGRKTDRSNNRKTCAENTARKFTTFTPRPDVSA